METSDASVRDRNTICVEYQRLIERSEMQSRAATDAHLQLIYIQFWFYAPWLYIKWNYNVSLSKHLTSELETNHVRYTDAIIEKGD